VDDAAAAANITTFQLGGSIARKIPPPPPPPPPPFDFVAPPPSPMARQILSVQKLVIKLLFSIDYKMVAFNDDKEKLFISEALKWLKAKCVQPRQLLSLNVTDIYSGEQMAAAQPPGARRCCQQEHPTAVVTICRSTQAAALPQPPMPASRGWDAYQRAQDPPPLTPNPRPAGSTVMMVTALFRPDTDQEAVASYSTLIMSAELAEMWYSEGLERSWGALLHAEVTMTTGGPPAGGSLGACRGAALLQSAPAAAPSGPPATCPASAPVPRHGSCPRQLGPPLTPSPAPPLQPT
jgi:hypothetical protein